ncbi:MAG: ABC transporter permease, partial [Amylibacter sp.]
MALTDNNGGARDRAPFPPWIRTTLGTLGSIAVTMLGLMFITFIIGRVMPIDPVLAIVGEQASKSTYDAAYQQLGLDRPILVQFFYYVWDVLHGDFGDSLLNARPVVDDIKRVFPATMELATLGVFMGIVLGVPLGVIAAV